jgi:hypothetical protein
MEYLFLGKIRGLLGMKIIIFFVGVIFGYTVKHWLDCAAADIINEEFNTKED